LGQTEVDARREDEFVLWGNTFKARLKDDATEETRLRSELDTNFKALKDAKKEALEEFHSLNGTGPSITTNGPQASHGTSAPRTRARTPTFASTPCSPTAATSMYDRVLSSPRRSSHASTSQHSQPPITSRSAQAQTELEKLQAKVKSICEDGGFSAMEKIARIGMECEHHENRANTSAPTSRYQDWGQGVSTLPTMTA
jgi:hypothetical protein